MAGAFLPQGLGSDYQVPQVDVILDRPGAPQADEDGRRHALGRLHHGDGAAGGADPGGDDRHRDSPVRAGVGQELTVFSTQFHPVKELGDSPGPVRVAAGEDIRGQVAGAAVEMIIASLRVLGKVDVDHRIVSAQIMPLPWLPK